MSNHTKELKGGLILKKVRPPVWGFYAVFTVIVAAALFSALGKFKRKTPFSSLAAILFWSDNLVSV